MMESCIDGAKANHCIYQIQNLQEEGKKIIYIKNTYQKEDADTHSIKKGIHARRENPVCTYVRTIYLDGIRIYIHRKENYIYFARQKRIYISGGLE